MLVNRFCDERGLDASGLQIDVDYDVADHPTRFQNIKVMIRLPNTVCDDAFTREALEHVAKHCPVHETILTLEKVNFELATA